MLLAALLRWDSKLMVRALITGSSRGLGREISLHLASQGIDILLHYRQDEKAASNTAQQCSSYSVAVDVLQGDFSSSSGIESFLTSLKRYGHIDYLINNASEFLLKPLSETTSEEWQRMFHVNVHAPIRITQFLIKSALRVINIGVAGVGRSRAVKDAVAYTVTKETLWSYTRSLALTTQQGTVNMISPGILENSEITYRLDHLPVPRVISFSEVAKVVSFLIGKAGDAITGQNIEIEGGLRL
ncbi:MAG: 3-oxoacyl-ACP reductase FabG [Chlamydiales bacterium]